MRGEGKHPASHHVWQCDILWSGCCCKHVEHQTSSDLSRLAVVCNALGSVVVCCGSSWRVGEHHPLVVVSGCEDPCSCCQDCALRGHWGHMLNIVAIIYWQQKVPCSAQ